MIICIMSGVEPLSQSRNYTFLDQPCPIAHDNDIGIFLFHQLRFFLPSVKTFLFHQPGFFSAIRNEAFTARFLHRILSLLHRILSLLHRILSLLRIIKMHILECTYESFTNGMGVHMKVRLYGASVSLGINNCFCITNANSQITIPIAI